jgi:branched-chain amino acid transport system substrate-binding protein
MTDFRCSRSQFLRMASAAALGFAVHAAVAPSAFAQTSSKEPVLIGVTGPLTGQYAQYGAQWKKGFDLALDEINAAGGINGRPLQYVFEDSQSDPRQTVNIARKYVADERIVVEIGDFSSAASMAASPIYQAAGLVQFGFSNSHPDFTKGGDYIWSNAVNQKDEMPLLADFVRDLGLKRIAVLFINSDWGRTAKDLLAEAVKKRGGEVVGSEGYLADEKDFRSAIVRVRDANPDGIALISYYPDGAQITRQIHNAGLKQPIVAGGSIYSPKFLELGGDAVNGVLTTVPFFPGDTRPDVQKFVKDFTAKFGVEPDAYNGRAYDTMILLASVMRQYGADRKAIKDGLGKIKDVPSVVYGKVKFDTETRRVADPLVSRIMVKDGKWAAWEGTAATR